jgi:DNA-binding transcriptional ArsR family regulator
MIMAGRPIGEGAVTKIKIMSIIVDNKFSQNEIATKLDMSTSTVSRHLTELSQNNLVSYDGITYSISKVPNMTYYAQLHDVILKYSIKKLENAIKRDEQNKEKMKKRIDKRIKDIANYKEILSGSKDELKYFGDEDDPLRWAYELEYINKEYRRTGLPLPSHSNMKQNEVDVTKKIEPFIKILMDWIDDAPLSRNDKEEYALEIKKLKNKY